jgi:hypothetical protein
MHSEDSVPAVTLQNDQFMVEDKYIFCRYPDITFCPSFKNRVSQHYRIDVLIDGHRRRGRCRRHLYSSIQHLSPVP